MSELKASSLTDRNGGVMHTVTAALIAMTTEQKGPVYAIAQFPHMNDSHLFLVCVEHKEGQFVTWMYNAQDGGFSDGRYFTMGMPQANRSCAMGDFGERYAKYLRLARGDF